MLSIIIVLVEIAYYLFAIYTMINVNAVCDNYLERHPDKKKAKTSKQAETSEITKQEPAEQIKKDSDDSKDAQNITDSTAKPDQKETEESLTSEH